MSSAVASRDAWIAVEKSTGFEGLTEWAAETGKIQEIQEDEKND